MLDMLLRILYVPVCIFLILVVLLQTGKRADLAGAFGGGGSQTAFGSRGAATLLTKVTTASAVLFMVIALTLSIISTGERGSGGTVLDEVPATTTDSAPADTPLELTETPPATEPTTPAEDENLLLVDEDASPQEVEAEPTGEDDQP